MPKAFREADWLLSLIVVIVLSAISFVSMTFVTESLSLTNAVTKTQKRPNTTTQVDRERNMDKYQETIHVRT